MGYDGTYVTYVSNSDKKIVKTTFPNFNAVAPLVSVYHSDNGCFSADYVIADPVTFQSLFAMPGQGISQVSTQTSLFVCSVFDKTTAHCTSLCSSGPTFNEVSGWSSTPYTVFNQLPYSGGNAMITIQ